MSASHINGVGFDGPRFDADAKVTGEASYPADAVPADALHAVTVFSNEPHARMTSMSTARAEGVEGVVVVITAKDVPVNEYGLTKTDQPVLVGLNDTGRSAVPGDVSRWEADHVAVIVAETVAAARSAAALLDIEWERLPLVDTIEAARSDEVLLHPEEGSNVYHPLRIRKGDVGAGWAEADVVIEGTYELPHQEHAFLQVESATAWIDEQRRVTVRTSGQWVHEDREQIAHALDLPEEEVRVMYASMGGAFGGKEDMSLQIVLALAAQKVAAMGIHRPVHCRWSREESIIGHHKRHRATIHAKLGATRDGVVTAVEADVWLDAGAYNYTSNKVLGNAHLSVAGAYEVPNAADRQPLRLHQQCSRGSLPWVWRPAGGVRRRDSDEQIGCCPRDGSDRTAPEEHVERGQSRDHPGDDASGCHTSRGHRRLRPRCA